MPFLSSFHITGRHMLRALSAIAVFMLLSTLKVNAQSPTDEEVKSLYVYNFVKFVEWPASAFATASDSFVIGVAGEGNYLNILSELVKGETYKGRKIEVRKVDSHAKVKDCHILFIGNRVDIVDEFVERAKTVSVLTISDIDSFMESGGMVRFFLEDSKVKIEINQKLAQERQLLISAKLLRLAKLYGSEDK